MKKSNHKFYILLIIAMCFWGITWPLGKITGSYAPFKTVVFLRLLISFFSIIPLFFVFKTHIKIKLKNLLFIFLGGGCITLYNFLFFAGLKHGLPGSGGVVVTTLNPVVTYILWTLFYKKKINLKAFLGLLFGITGGLILLRVWELSVPELFKSGNLYFILCALSWAFVTIISQKSQIKVNFIQYSFYLYLSGSLISSLFVDWPNINTLFQLPVQFWLLLLYMSLITISFASTIFFIASSKLGSHKAGSFIFIVPLAAVISSFFIMGEVPQLTTIAGGLLAILAIYLINQSNK